MPASAEVVRARDAAIMATLAAGPQPWAALLAVLPQEPGQDDVQRHTALSNALTRLQIKSLIEYREEQWHAR